MHFLHLGETEIGGFGVTSNSDPLYVEDFCTVKQKVSIVSVSFDDLAVADFFEDQVDAGRKPEQFGRIWLHTHPGNSPTPSLVDEDTFLSDHHKMLLNSRETSRSRRIAHISAPTV